MKIKKFMVLALALSLPACSLMAQNDGPPPGPPPDGQNDGPPPDHGTNHFGGRMRRPPMPLIQALDANHDGVISAAEIANAPAALKTLDKNGDGQLTKDEYMPPRPNHDGGTNAPPDGPPGGGPDDSGHKHPVPPIVTALDTNGDGVISADEIANASTSLLKLDKNGDGKLTRDEYMPPRPQGQRGGGPGGPGEDGPPDGGQRPPPPGDN